MLKIGSNIQLFVKVAISKDLLALDMRILLYCPANTVIDATISQSLEPCWRKIKSQGMQSLDHTQHSAKNIDSPFHRGAK